MCHNELRDYYPSFIMILDLLPTAPREGATVITGIRGRHQLDSYSCGYTAACTVVAATNGKLSSSDKATLLALTKPTRHSGVTVGRMRAALRHFDIGMRSIPTTFRKVQGSIEQGRLLLAALRLPWQPSDESHWMVAAGVDPAAREVLLLNRTGLPLFSRRWWSWLKCRDSADGGGFWVVDVDFSEYTSSSK